LALALAAFSGWMAGCDSEEGSSVEGGTTSSTEKGEVETGDIEGVVGDKIKVGAAIVTVRALQATFQPAVPELVRLHPDQLRGFILFPGETCRLALKHFPAFGQRLPDNLVDEWLQRLAI